MSANVFGKYRKPSSPSSAGASRAKVPFRDRLPVIGQAVVDNLNDATLREAVHRETDPAKKRELEARIAELERLAQE